MRCRKARGSVKTVSRNSPNWRKNDPESSQWALDSVTDPAIKAAASKWRQDWQDQTKGGKR
jgi:hypothetical protein